MKQTKNEKCPYCREPIFHIIKKDYFLTDLIEMIKSRAYRMSNLTAKEYLKDWFGRKTSEALTDQYIGSILTNVKLKGVSLIEKAAAKSKIELEKAQKSIEDMNTNLAYQQKIYDEKRLYLDQ
jgi:hypothetical protein